MRKDGWESFDTHPRVTVRSEQISDKYAIATLAVELDIATEIAVLERLLFLLSTMSVGGLLIFDAQEQFIDVRGYSALQRVDTQAERTGCRFLVVRPPRSLRLMCEAYSSSLRVFDSIEDSARSAGERAMTSSTDKGSSASSKLRGG